MHGLRDNHPIPKLIDPFHFPSDKQSRKKNAIPVIARVAGKGTLHWRAAARKISRLTRQVNALEGP